MGSSYSTPNENPTDKVENVKKLFDVSQNNDFLDSLNISELKNFSTYKEQLPILGGTSLTKDEDLDSHYNIDFNLIGGGSTNDVRFMSKNRRYLRHNIFKIISQLESSEKFQQGGNVDEKDLSTSDDDDAIKHIKQIILKEVNKLNSGKQSGGACGCGGNAGSDDVQEGGAKKSKKSKKSGKSKKSQKGGRRGAPRRKRAAKKDDVSSLTDSEDNSDSDSSSSSSSSENSYNSGVKSSFAQSESSLNSESEESEESGKGGLSIFPFNSSEVKSTVSEKKNSRMIRRKI
jgi:hypothetical protein